MTRDNFAVPDAPIRPSDFAVSPTSLRPVGDRVLVRRDGTPGKSAGGVHLPETAMKIPRLGTVIAVGPGKPDPETGLRTPPDVQPGNRVYIDYRKAENVDAETGGSLLNSGTHYVLVPGDAVLGVVEE